jgi:hypothetical protein
MTKVERAAPERVQSLFVFSGYCHGRGTQGACDEAVAHQERHNEKTLTRRTLHSLQGHGRRGRWNLFVFHRYGKGTQGPWHQQTRRRRRRRRFYSVICPHVRVQFNSTRTEKLTLCAL